MIGIRKIVVLGFLAVVAFSVGCNYAERQRRLAIEKEETDWTAARSSGTEQALLAFINGHPDGKHADEAKSTIVALRPCKATGGGDVTLTNGPDGKFMKQAMGLTGDDRLVGVVIECQAGPTGIMLRINRNNTYATKAGDGAKIGFSFIQPIDVDNLQMALGGILYRPSDAYGNTTMNLVTGSGERLGTEVAGLISQIGGAPDRNEKGRPLASYDLDLIKPSVEITLGLPPHARSKFAILFSGSSHLLNDAFLGGDDLYYRPVLADQGASSVSSSSQKPLQRPSIGGGGQYFDRVLR